MASNLRFIDILSSFVPEDLSNRPGLDVGFKALWTWALFADLATEALTQGIASWFPGLGTPSARTMLAENRGITRGPGELSAEFDERLRTWLVSTAEKGQTLGLLRQIQAYVPGRPKVRGITRSGHWVTLDTDGTVTVETSAWTWDELLLPERAAFWSNLFVVVYTSAWDLQDACGTGKKVGVNEGAGFKISRSQAQELRALIREWKAARTRVRCVIFTSNAALFDPLNPASVPDGTWGRWGKPGGAGYNPTSARVRARTTACRYMEI